MEMNDEEPPMSQVTEELNGEVVNLASTAEKIVVENLGDLAESLSCRYTCGGELTSPDKISWYMRTPQDICLEALLCAWQPNSLVEN